MQLQIQIQIQELGCFRPQARAGVGVVEVSHRLVLREVERLELREAHEVRADEDAQVAPLALAALELARVAQVLHAHPELVHLAEVEQHELDRVRHRAARRIAGRGPLARRRLGPIVERSEHRDQS